MTETPVRNLLVVLGDQLNADSALFLAAMRHFAVDRRDEGWRVDYRELPVDPDADDLPPPRPFPPDRLTREVIGLVERRFPNHPGSGQAGSWRDACRRASTD
ncbi:MAG: cryptochrome/photolyase family protein [Guyparkeria sp.]